MDLKWISIVLAAFAAVVLAFVWFNVLFKKLTQGKTGEFLLKLWHAPIAFAFSLFIAYGLWRQVIGLHNFIKSLKESAGEITEYPFFHGAFHGVQSSFFYGVISVLILDALFNAKNYKLSLLSVCYWVLTMGLMGGIIGWLGALV